MAAVADAVGFRAALQRIGFNQNTQAAINQNGFNVIADLTTVQEDNLDRLPKHLEAWRDPNAGPADQVCIPFLLLKKLKAMRYWVRSQFCLGLPTPSATAFTNAVLEETLLLMKEDLDYKEATKEAEVQKPIELANLSKWSKFWELFSTYLSRIKGAANTPLSYLIREHEEVTQEMLDADYASTVNRLIATTVLDGAHFDLDNRMLYGELKALVVDGPGWAFIRKFDKAKDGRKAVLALKAQAEGLSSTLTRKMKAYASIASAVYRGPRRGFTFTDYVSVHQEAHNELFDCKVAVEDSKKVDDFLNGIQDPGLVVGKTVVLSNPLKLGDFEACQQYLSTLVANMSNRAKSSGDCNASLATRGGGGDNSALID